MPGAHIVGDEQAQARRFQGHHHRYELEVLGDDAAALQTEQRGCAVEEAETVGSEEKVLGGRMSHDVGRGGVQTARTDILEGEIELDLLRLAAINGGGDENSALLSVYSPQTTAVGDDGSGGEYAVVLHNGSPMLSSNLGSSGATPLPHRTGSPCSNAKHRPRFAQEAALVYNVPAISWA